MTLPSDVFEEPTQDQQRSSKAQARQDRKAAKEQKRVGFQAKPLQAKTPMQADYIQALTGGEHCLAVGGAGVGKTYLPARIAAQKLLAKEIERIVIARVAVSKPKHKQGFLPGKLSEKMAPWMVPIFDGLRAEVSAKTLEDWRNDGRVEIADFEHMRGRTFSNALVILDEAQNADWTDLKMFVTRTGEGSQVVITGDLDQIDVPDSGLADFTDMVRRFGLPLTILEFAPDDVVRSDFTRAFVKAYAQYRRPSKSVPGGDTNLDSPPAFLNNGRR